MENFQPAQRWTSMAEPELGLGIVVETVKGRVRLDYPAAGETRLYAIETAPLRRVTFKEGDTVIDLEGQSMVIERVFENNGVLIYFGKTRVLAESELGNMTLKHGADDRLLLGEVDSPRQFALRRRTLQNDHNRRISPINGFLGGRIDLIPHQLYIAHEVSARFAPRVLLSDEVGLGKTIEACLVIHRLLLCGRISRVLILVPDSLVHQWFVELLRRFNLWFNIFDEHRAASAQSSAPEGNPFLDSQLILCGSSFLAKSPQRAQQAIAAGWDMLVVDEAHHLEWTPELASPAYQVVEALGKETEGLLLLTATPEQLGMESHFARLRLLDPERYSDLEAFKSESMDHKETADIVDQLAEGKELTATGIAYLERIVGKERMEAFLKDPQNGRAHLIQDLLDQHGPGRVIFRNRRSAMRKFPRRIVRLAPIPPHDAPSGWPQHVLDEVHADLRLGELKLPLSPDYSTDPRLKWLLALLDATAPGKVLLICNSKEKVIALEKAIKEHSSHQVGVFHEELSLVLRDRNAAWFAEPEGALILLCSEIGSEGRNFQFAHHLVLFDLPTNPELLEQRIGRLDRIGQTEDIQIHVPYLSGTGQEALVTWYHAGLNAFEQNLEGGNRISQAFGDELLACALQAGDASATHGLEDLVRRTRDFHTALKAQLASGRDRLLEMNSFRPEIGDGLVGKIEAQDQHAALENYMMEVFDAFNIETEDLAPRTYLVLPYLGNALAFPGLEEEGSTVTFDRKRALSREDIGFLSWDHPLVTGAIDIVLGTGLGAASYAIRKGRGGPDILLEVLFVLETIGANSKAADRFLPNTPLRVVVDHTGKDLSADFPFDELDLKLHPGQIDDILDDETLMETILPIMLEAATRIAEHNAQAKIATALYRMNSTHDHEIQRLQTLQTKNNHIRPQEIQTAIDEQQRLKSLLLDAKIRLDAVQLILGEGY